MLADEFKYKNKDDAQSDIVRYWDLTYLKIAPIVKELLQQFQLWKNSAEEAVFWGEKVVELEKKSASYDLEVDEIKTEKAAGPDVGSSLRSSLRRRRPSKNM